LNPGHSSGVDEWLHTSFRPGSKEEIASGMAIQCDIIPAPLEDGIQLNNEDPVVIADKKLREEMKSKYPEMWNRIKASRSEEHTSELQSRFDLVCRRLLEK